MKSFECFAHSIETLRQHFQRAARINFETICEEDWATLKEIFCGIDVMRTGTKLIGNSKVMSHMLPDIIPPIDREYSLKFFKLSLKNNLEYEWGLMRNIIQNFFIPVAQDEGFIGQATVWIRNQSEFPWDTSVFKVIDNLIIGKKKG